MVAINWNQMAVPDFKAANALLLSGQEQFNTAIGQAGKVVTDYQAANTKNNTQAIMNALQSAKSPEEYQAALESAQAIAATKSGDFDQDKFNAAQLTQPGVLDAQQQQQLEIADRSILAQLGQGVLEGKKREDLAPLYGQLKSNAGRASAAAFGQQAFANTETLKNSDTAARTAANTEARIASDERANAIKEAALRQKEYQEGAGGSSYRDPVTGEWRTTNTVDFERGGIPSSGSVNVREAQYLNKSQRLAALPQAQTTLKGATVDEILPFLMGNESGGKHTDDKGNLITSPAGAKGKGQFIQATRDQVLKQSGFDAYDPNQVEQATRYHLNDLLKQNGGDMSLALASYNAGKPNVDMYKGIPPFRETQNYVLDIAASYAKAKGGNAPIPSDAAANITTGKTPNPYKANAIRETNSLISPVVGTKALQGYQGDLATTLRNINVDAGIKEEKLDTATNEANEAKYMSKNKPGIIQAIFNLNSGSKRQRSIGESVDGFNLLPSKTRLAIMEKVAAENNTETFKYWSSLDEDELRAKFASSVKKHMNTEAPGLSGKRQAAVENAVTKFGQDNVWRNGKPSPYTILSTVMGSDEEADAFIHTYPDSELSKSILGASSNGAPTPAAAANTIAAGTTVGKPAVKAPVVRPVYKPDPRDVMATMVANIPNQLPTAPVVTSEVSGRQSLMDSLRRARGY